LEENSKQISWMNDPSGSFRTLSLDDPGSPADEEASSNSTQAPSGSLHIHNPYLNLNDVEMDIIHCLKDLTLRTHRDSRQDWDSISITAILDLACERRPDVTKTAFLDTLSSLIQDGFIYRPIVNSHCLLNE